MGDLHTTPQLHNTKMIKICALIGILVATTFAAPAADVIAEEVPDNIVPKEVPDNIVPEDVPDNIVPKDVPDNIVPKDENLVADRNRWGFIKSNIGRKKKTKWNSERMRKILAKYGEDESLVADRNRWGFIKSNIGRKKKTRWNSERMKKILAKY